MNSPHSEMTFLHRRPKSDRQAPGAQALHRKPSEQWPVSGFAPTIDDSLSRAMNKFSFAEIEGRPISTGRNFTAGNTMSIHLLHSRAVSPSSPIWKPCRILGEWLESFTEVLATWASRSRERNLLAQMSEADLKDIGVSRYDAMMEIQKPFWRP
jgi:uncharacterized protein YjiS (DUF1127 family)